MTDPVKKSQGVSPVAQAVQQFQTCNKFGEKVEVQDEADLVVTLRNSDGYVRSCAAKSLEALLNGPYAMPSTGVGLVRQVYRSLPAEREWYRALLVKMISHLDPPTDDAIDFLEEVLRTNGGAKKDYPSSPSWEVRAAVEKLGDRLLPTAFRFFEEGAISAYTLDSMISFPLRSMLEPKAYLESFIRGIARLRGEGSLKNYVGDFTPIARLFSWHTDFYSEMTRIFMEGDASVRLACIKILPGQDRRIRGLWAPLLIESLKSSDEELREEAADTLIYHGGFGHETISDPYVWKAVESSDAVLSKRVMEILLRRLQKGFIGGWNFSREQIFFLTQKLNDSDPESRRLAVQMLGLCGSEGVMALPLLVSVHLNDPDESCRISAKEAIAKIEEEVL